MVATYFSPLHVFTEQSYSTLPYYNLQEHQWTLMMYCKAQNLIDPHLFYTQSKPHKNTDLQFEIVLLQKKKERVMVRIVSARFFVAPSFQIY